jgi:hypothetical protein
VLQAPEVFTTERLVLKSLERGYEMNPIPYKTPVLGDEYQMSGCMWASAVLWELTDGAPESVTEWRQIAPSKLA